MTLLFDREQYLGAADAYMRGLERRVEAGLNPDVASVASVFVSRWDAAVTDTVPDELRDKLGLAIGKRTYAAYRELLDSDRAMRLRNEGAKAQRLLWASTGTKDPDASDVLYIEGLAAPFTVNTMPEKTMKAFADHGTAGETLPIDGGDAEEVLKAFNDAGIDTDALATKLQEDGADGVRQVLGRAARRRSPRRRPRPRRPVADIRLIAVPYELGRLRDGVGLGPEALLEHGAERALAERGARVETALIELDEPDDNEVDTSFAVIGRVAEEVRSAVDAGALPVVLSGSCFAAVGVVAGLGEPPPGVVWLDAHGDYNEPGTSVYGYLDGMGLAILVGDAWQGLAAQVPGFNAIGQSAVLHGGGRAFDEPEVARLDASDIRLLDADSLGDPVAVGDAVRALDVEPRGLYLHIDLDVLDASVARVNRYAASGGVTADALERVVRVLIGIAPVRAVSLTAYEPELDPEARGAPDRHEAARRGRRIARGIVPARDRLRGG